jgi:hypothetical protein
VPLFARRGYDRAERYPQIREAILGLPQNATIDGEVVVCDPMGVADFELLHSREHDRRASSTPSTCWDSTASICALPLERRKDQLRKLGGMTGIQFNEHVEEHGATVFAHACRLGCEASSARIARVPTDLGQARPGSRSKTGGARRASVRRPQLIPSDAPQAACRAQAAFHSCNAEVLSSSPNANASREGNRTDLARSRCARRQ